MVVLFDGYLPVQYSFGFLVEDEFTELELDETIAGQSNGLLGGASAGGLMMLFGLHTGLEPMVIEWHDHEPPVAATGVPHRDGRATRNGRP
jgi:hypothetical protein